MITGCLRINGTRWYDGGLICKNTELLLLFDSSMLSEMLLFEVNGVTAFTKDVDEEEDVKTLSKLENSMTEKFTYGVDTVLQFI